MSKYTVFQGHSLDGWVVIIDKYRNMLDVLMSKNRNERGKSVTKSPYFFFEQSC